MNIFDKNILKGKKILITGASSGIGKNAAKKISELGAEIIISGRNKLKLCKTKEEIVNKNNCHIEDNNLLNFESILEWINKLNQKYGTLDGVFHCAGEALIKPMRLIKGEDYEKVINPSLMAAAAICTGLSKKNSLNNGSSIILMSSVAGKIGRQGLGLYSASKAGIDGLARSLAIELASRKITVNSIAAGGIKTEMHQTLKIINSNQVIGDYELLHPLGFGEMEDITNMVAYLLSPAGRWITGTAITIDGGYSAK